jgi:hypothetical protein
LSEQRRLQAESDVAGVADQISIPAEKTVAAQEEAPRMATRRSTRRSGVAIDQTTPAETVSLPFPTKTPMQTTTQEDSTIIDAGDEDVNADQNAPSSPRHQGESFCYCRDAVAASSLRRPRCV